MARVYDKWLLSAAAAAVALMFLNLGITYHNAGILREHGNWVVHTHQVMEGLDVVFARVSQAEAAQRGYIITGDESYLTSHAEAVAALNAALARFESLTTDNARQQERLPELRRRVAVRLETLQANIDRRRNDFEEARDAIATNVGRQQMEAVQSLLGEMRADERELLDERSRAADRAYRTTTATELLSGLSALAAVGVLLLALRRNLAARTRAAALLAQERELLQTTLASIGDAVISTDAEARIVYLNAVAQSITGWSQQDAEGQPLDVVFNIVNEQTRRQVENPAVRSLREGVIVGLANHTVLIAKDGTERPIDDSAAPIRDRKGNVAGCVLVFRDVSERRRSDLALRDSESKYRTLVEQVKDYAIFRTDTIGRATTWNEGVRSVLGFEHNEFVGRDIASLIFTPEDVEHGVPHRELETAAARGSASDDRWMKMKDGTRFWAAGVTEALRDDAGKLIGFTKVMRDRTDAKKMEDELRQFAADLSEADRRKNEFLAMLAHELRNPLAPIRNALEIMRRSDGSVDQVESAIAMMQRQVSQMVRLIDDLLDVSRISRGAIDLQLGRVELASVINHALDACRPLCDNQRLELVVELPQSPVYLHADPARLHQIVGNLLSNACKFTPQGGRIDLRSAVEGDVVVIQVQDTGVGIAPDQLPLIFDMFMQADTSLERSQSGLGIGLTLVKRLVEMHGGTVEAASAGIGNGSQFTVRLPIMSAPAPVAAPAAGEGTAMVSGRRILVVDDNRDAAESLAMLLKLTRNEVHLAYDGEEALAAAVKHRPEVILLDIGLPKLNGYEVARRIRREPWGKTPVLVALTGWGQDEDRAQSSEAGFDGHLVKPVEHAALMSLLADALPPV